MCANVIGYIKLPLLLLGKVVCPRHFRSINMASLPVTYMNQQNAWVDTTIFSLWFHNHFVHSVQKQLQEMKLPKKALLILDNCSAHPDEELLVSKDKLVKAMFLPPNVTSLIQPMDQGVLECLKRHYKRSLLCYLMKQ